MRMKLSRVTRLMIRVAWITPLLAALLSAQTDTAGLFGVVRDASGGSVGSAVVTRGASVSEVESTKSVSDVYAPVSGTVVETNDDLADAPQKINEDPYGDGWIAVIELADTSELDLLLDAAAYRALVEG